MVTARAERETGKLVVGIGREAGSQKVAMQYISASTWINSKGIFLDHSRWNETKCTSAVAKKECPHCPFIILTQPLFKYEVESVCSLFIK